MPVAAYPGGDAGRAFARRHLQRLARRTAYARRQESRRSRASRSAIASTATPASPSARRASTFATASSSNALPARCASTPATAIMDKLGRDARPDLLCDACRLQLQHGARDRPRDRADQSRRGCETTSGGFGDRMQAFRLEDLLPPAHADLYCRLVGGRPRPAVMRCSRATGWRSTSRRTATRSS